MSKKFIRCCILLLCLNTTALHAQSWKWALGSTKPLGGFMEGFQSAIDNSGNIVMTAENGALQATFGTINVPNPSGSDYQLMVIKADSSGR